MKLAFRFIGFREESDSTGNSLCELLRISGWLIGRFKIACE